MRERSADRPTRSQTVLTWALTFVWGCLILFGIVSAASPAWLRALSQGGIEVESREVKSAADALLRSRQIGRAIGLYQYALRVRPDYTGATVNLAIAHRESGALDKAEATLRAALREGERRRGVIAYNLAETLERRGKREEAIRYYKEALGSTVSQEQVHLKLGALHFDAGDLEEARDAFVAALKVQTDPTAPYRRMLQRTEASLDGDSSDRELIEELLARPITELDLDPYDMGAIARSQRESRLIVPTYTYLGRVHGQLGDPESAIEHLEKAMELSPGNRGVMRALEEQRRLLKQSEGGETEE